MSHRGRWVVVGLLAGFFVSPLALAFASWNATAAGSTSTQALTIGSGNAPSVSVSGRDASLSWSATQFSNGVPLPGYLVQRYDADGLAPTAVTSGSCAGVVYTTACTESAVPPGSWKYTVTPAAGNWRGAESPQIAATVAAPALTLAPGLVATPATLSGSVSGLVAGLPVTFRLDDPVSGTLLAGTVAGASTPTAMPAGASAAVTVDLPGGVANGDHTVYAITAGNAESAQAPVTVDNTAPAAPTLTGTPADPTGRTSATFTFEDTDDAALFRCRLDGGAWATCSSPVSYTALADAIHTFEVVAVNALGTASPTTSYTWTVDTVPPDATLTFPGSGQSYTSTNYTAGCAIGVGDLCGTTSPGTSGDPVALVEVSIRRAGTGLYWTGVGTGFTSPTEQFFSAATTDAWATWSYALDVASLPADGAYVVRSRATNSTNLTGSASAATFTLDNVAPAAPTWVTTPTAPSAVKSPTFAFVDTDPAATFQCKLDTALFAACGTPKTLSNLSDGSHTFVVRALDPAGNTSPSTSYTWTVDATAPATPTFTSTPPAVTSATSASASFTDAEGGVTFKCKLDTGTYAVCTSPATWSALADGLHTVSVTASDALGNTSAAVSTTWRVDTTAPTGTITFPVNGTLYNISTYNAGCSTPTTGDLCGTAADGGSGVSTVRVSIQQGTGSYWNGTTFGSATESLQTPTGTTSWSLPLAVSAMSNGTYTVRAHVTDAAGNPSATITSSFTIDAVSPPAPTISASPATPTTATTASFTFSDTQAGVTFQCALDGAAYATCTSPKSYPGLSDATHTFSVIAVSSGGNPSAATTRTWLVDTTAPTGAITNPVNPAYNAATFTAGCGTAATADVCGTAADAGSGVSTVRVSIQKGTGNYWNGSTFGSGSEVQLTPTGTTSWTYPLPTGSLTNGTAYTVRLRVTDAVSLTSTVTTASFTYDTSAPANPTFTTKPPATTSSSSVTYAFADSDATATFLCNLDGTGYIACPTPYTITGLADGAHTLQLQAIDPAGNTSGAVSNSFTVDTTAPTGTFTHPTNGSSYKQSNYESPCGSTAGDVCGTATDTGVGLNPVTLSIQQSDGLYYGGATFNQVTEKILTASGTATWSYALPVADLLNGSSYTIKVYLKDKLNNSSTIVSTFTYDTTPPPTPGITGPSSPSTTSSPTFTFTDGDPTAAFACSLDAAAYVACPTPYALTGLADGAHTLSVLAVDPAVNVSGAATWSWTIDATAPTLNVAFPANGGSFTTSGYNAGCSTPATGDWCGTASDAGTGLSTVQLSLRQAGTGQYWNGTSFGSATEVLLSTTGTSSWSYVFSTASLPGDGSYVLRVVATDVAGNSASASSAFTYDNTPPPAPGVSGPSSPSGSSSASLTLTDTEPGVTYTCALDGGAASACTSPASFTGLSDGSHTVSVIARDAAGNASTATSYTWTVDVTAPTSGTTFPVASTGYSSTSWPAGCATPGTGDLCGTAADTGSGVATVRISVQQGTGSYWNGTSFGSATEVLLTATGTTSWSYNLAAGSLTTGSYTLRVYVTDNAGNTSTVDTTPFSYNAAGCTTPGTTNLTADADTYVREDSATSNYGTVNTMVLKADAGTRRRMLVHFPLAAVPAGCTVSSATLTMFETSASTPHTLNVVNAAAAWTETGVSWSTQPSTTGAPSSTAAAAGSVSWTVTGLVQAQYAGTNNGFGVLDAADGTGSGQQTFASRENGTVANRPKLSVTLS